MKKRALTRRDFLRAAAVGPLAGAAVSSGFHRLLRADSGAGKSRVILIRDKDVLEQGRKPKPEVIQEMLDRAVAALLGEKDAAGAWKKLIMPTDTVGIKTNVWRYLPTGPEVEQSLRRRILEAGVPEERIGIADRGILSNPLFTGATALINVRPARSHHWSGMGGCIKNMIMFVPNPSAYHDDTCADLASFWKLPLIKDKVRLNVLTLLTPLFHGIGPHHFSEQYIWEYKGILVGLDPVAVDAIGMRILEAKRRDFFGEDRPLQPPAHHVRYAETRHQLGVSDPAKIELIRIGWTEGLLIQARLPCGGPAL